MRPKNVLYVIISLVLATFVFNEFIVYYLVISQCKWPMQLKSPVKAMLLSDTHLLGPFKGHWLDKLRREWQMFRAFQAAISLHGPDVVFILGDVFDEGQWVNDVDFRSYLSRYHQIFHTPDHIQVFSTVGNHDVGFHYKLHPHIMHRFEQAFNESKNTILTIKDTHFVLLNSMTLHRDGCYFCETAEAEIRALAKRLNCAKSDGSQCAHQIDKLPFYSRPILLQHFPTYRLSDKACDEHDSPETENYREGWEVLSKDATQLLGNELDPRVAFSGHSHHYCRVRNMWNVDEYTIASFSWRNKPDPSFLLAEFNQTHHAVAKCDMPREGTVIAIYAISAVICLLLFLHLLACWRAMKRRCKKFA